MKSQFVYKGRGNPLILKNYLNIAKCKGPQVP